MNYYSEEYQYPNPHATIEVALLQYELNESWNKVFLERISVTWKDRINKLLSY